MTTTKQQALAAPADLRTLALKAIALADLEQTCAERDYNDVIADAFDAKQNFLSALRIQTGIDAALWDKLGGSVL